MSSKIAVHDGADANSKLTDVNNRHRRPLQVIQNQHHFINSNQIKKQKRSTESSTNENQPSFASRMEAIRNFRAEIFNDNSDSDDDFDDENYKDIMKKFEHFDNIEAKIEMPKPTTEQMDDIYIRNTVEAKQGSNRKFPFDPADDDPEFGRVQ